MRLMRRGCAAAALLPLLAACSPDHSSPAAQEVPAVPAPTAQVRALVLPFDSYEPSAADLRTVDVAQDLLLARCMEKKGLEWSSPRRAPADSPAEFNRRRYGVVEPKIARVFGYHMTPTSSEKKEYEAEREARDQSLTDEQSVAAYGPDGTEGCDLEAYEDLVRDGGRPDYGVFNRISSDIYKRSRRDPDVVAAMGRWQSCMRGKGFAYDSPLDAMSDHEWARTSRPARKETRTAEADVACQQRADLVQTWYGAEKRLQQDAIRSDSGKLEKFRDAVDTRLKTAERVLGQR